MNDTIRKAKKDFDYLLNPDTNPMMKKMKIQNAKALEAKNKK
jgi:hypothetical protein